MRCTFTYSRILFFITVACVPIAFIARAAQRDDPRVEIPPRPAAPKQRSGPAPIRVDVKLTLIPVTVTDAFGAPVSGLAQSSFRLLEDGVEQQVKYFSNQDAPVSLGVVFDASQSMVNKLDQSRSAVSRFFGTAVAGDEFFVVEFNDAPRLLCNFTSDTERIQKSLLGIQPRNWTALFDAVYMAVRQMKHARNPRRALLIVSDGGDNNSRYTEPEMRALVREADVCIYSLALVGGGLIKRHVGLLRHLSEETGGVIRQVEKMSDLPEAVEKLSAAMRNQYLLGYASTNARNNGLYRKIEVRLNESPELPPHARAYWRMGYYAPDER
jgi:Ca-activated chloride channel family protein